MRDRGRHPLTARSSDAECRAVCSKDAISETQRWQQDGGAGFDAIGADDRTF